MTDKETGKQAETSYAMKALRPTGRETAPAEITYTLGGRPYD